MPTQLLPVVSDYFALPVLNNATGHPKATAIVHFTRLCISQVTESKSKTYLVPLQDGRHHMNTSPCC